MYELDVNQLVLRGGQRVSDALLIQAARRVWKTLDLNGKVAISVAFVDEKSMQRLNKQYRGKNKITDVLSFGADPEDGSGEILLCYAKAKQQAAELHHTVRDEIVFLFVHGLLHLAGFDHEVERDAKRMFPLQAKILKGLGVDSRV